jgi:hypothetical protein
MSQIAKVADPDSATHFLCDQSPYPHSMTHHLVPTEHHQPVQRCRWCRRTDAEIRKEAGLW